MKVLVTGSQGFIGSMLLPELLKWTQVKREYKNQPPYGVESAPLPMITEVIGVDNLMFNQCTHAHIVNDSRYSFIRQDITDHEAMKELYDWADVILPLACITGAPLSEIMKSTSWDVNYTAIKKMMDYLLSTRGDNRPKVVVPVSNSGYGIKPPGVYTTEDDELNPVSTYGRTKVAIEKETQAYGGVRLRFATVYGPSLFHRVGLLVNTFTYRAMKDKVLAIYQGHFQRNYLYIQDAIQSLKLSIEKYDEMSGNVYNVGDSNANISKLDLAKLVAKLTGAEVIEVDNMKDPDIRSYLVDNSRIEALGFKPSISLEDGIKELIKFYSAVDERSDNVFFGTT